ncbi:MAG: response regulator [Elusimicrobia bacterium]|nr:response regulator [Elusimicrobiota bacterium]
MKKVAVVDDDEDMRHMMAHVLREHFEVETAEDGEAGLALARRWKPDLVVLDLLMPKMHGFEVCRNIRGDGALKTTKVLISSSKSYTHDVKTAVEESGADGYIVKPFRIADFQKRVAELLGGA